MSTGKIILIVIALLGFFGVAGFIGQFNGLRTLENGVQMSWANVENQYQRRYDLIPNIVETVKGEANFEKSTLTEVIEARSRMGGVIKMDESMLSDERAMKKFQEAQNSLGGALQRLMMVTENYPNLKANAAFRDLRVQLEGCENRINVARDNFNSEVNDYNSYIRRFPNNIIAGMFNFDKKGYFKAASGAENAPEVEFDFNK